eukprot:6202632-Pleurochrysis_carterae.AAC.1
MQVSSPAKQPSRTGLAHVASNTAAHVRGALSEQTLDPLLGARLALAHEQLASLPVEDELAGVLHHAGESQRRHRCDMRAGRKE